MEQERRWLIVIRNDNAIANASAIKNVKEIIEKMSVGKVHLAFSSKDGTVAGFYAVIAKPVRVIRSRLEETATTYDKGFVLVLEIGDEWTGLGNNTGWVWLQQH